MGEYHNSTENTSITSMGRGQHGRISHGDIHRALHLCESASDDEAKPIFDLLEEHNGVFGDGEISAEAYYDDADQEQRNKFYDKLADLVDKLRRENKRSQLQQLPYSWPAISDDHIYYDFLAVALSYRDHIEHEEDVKAAIVRVLNEDRRENQQLTGTPDVPYLELEFNNKESRRRVIRDIAKSMKMPVTEFVRQCSEKSGLPIPTCFNLAGSSVPPIEIPSLSQVRAVTPKPAFVVDGLIPDRAVTLAHGPTGRGKTYWCLEIAAAIIKNRPAFGHFRINRPGRVVFFEGENPEDVWHNRLGALEARHGSLEGQFVPVDRALPLNDPAMLERYLDMLRRLAAEQPISLIVNDTYRQSVGEENINDGATAAAAYRQFNSIAQEFKCAMLVTSHAPKGNDNENAGSQDLENLVPWSLLIKGKKQGGRLLTVHAQQGEKSRVGLPIVPFTVDCEPVQLDDGRSNLILVNYREPPSKAEKPDQVAEPALAASNGLSAEKRADIIERHRRGESGNQISRAMGLRRETVSQVINEEGLSGVRM